MPGGQRGDTPGMQDNTEYPAGHSRSQRVCAGYTEEALNVTAPVASCATRHASLRRTSGLPYGRTYPCPRSCSTGPVLRVAFEPRGADVKLRRLSALLEDSPDATI